MPAGIENPIVGYLGFCSVKLVGYTFAGRYLSRLYNRPDRKPLAVGATRTLIGMAAGAAYFGALSILPETLNMSFPVQIVALIPVRFAEWWLLLWIFYGKKIGADTREWPTVVKATAWSYVLDVPALAGLLALGGLWIC